MRQLISILTCTLTSITLNAEPKIPVPNFTVDSYVSKYRLVAQLESHRSGIPASIVLAQAILESGYGNSNLCQRSKNHFGIKWKNSKDGDFVYSLDDDYDKNGKHIPSKFINYKDDVESFRHHSDFLMERPHYKSLFRYDNTDFVSWANGLRECGYSTDKSYGVQLIQLIKRYALNIYDLPKHFIKKKITPFEHTKMLVSIFTGKNLNWSILLKKQCLILEETNLAIAKEAKLNASIANSFSIPVSPTKFPKNPIASETWAFLRGRSEVN